MKKITINRFLSIFVFITLVITIIFIIFAIGKAPEFKEVGMEHVKTKSDYMLMLSQCTLGAIALFIPSILMKRFKIEIPSTMLVLYTLFLYGAIFLGEVRSFYYNVPHWDTILHIFSGGMLGALGFSFVTLLNKTDKVPVNLSPIFIVLFSLCFAVTLGVIWEVYEFAFDGFLGLNMQKFALETGEQLIGREALIDTMKDLIVDTLGALVVAIIGYISLKNRKGWIEKILIKNIRRNKLK